MFKVNQMVVARKNLFNNKVKRFDELKVQRVFDDEWIEIKVNGNYLPVESKNFASDPSIEYQYGIVRNAT